MRFLAVVLLVACSSPAPPDLPVAYPRLGPQPREISFGRITSPQTRRLTVRNIGDTGSVLRVDEVRLDSGDFVVEGTPGVAPFTLDVTATAATPGFKSAELELVGNSGTVRVALSAEVVPYLPCELQLSTPRIDFGLVSEVETLAFELRSTSLGACALSQFELTGSTVFSFPSGQLPLEVFPGEVATLRVRVTPALSLQGAQTGTLRIGALRLELVATLALSCLTITPNDFDFGTVRIGCASLPRSFAIYNVCHAPVALSSVRKLGDAFHLPPSLPGSFAPGSAPGFLRVEFRPVDAGPSSGAIILTVDQLGQPVDHVVTLRGAGDGFTMNTDTFRIVAPPKVDLLVVLDDGASMAPRRMSVAENLDRILENQLWAGSDLNLGLTTSSADGGLVGPVLSSRAPMLRDLFAQQLASVGFTGPDAPPLLASAVAAAPGLRRDGGFLSVLSISDGDDRSPLPVATYTLQLPGSFSAIGPKADGGQPRAQAAVTARNGLAGDIADPRWSDAFTFGTIGQPERTDFFLTAAPVPGTLQVKVNGVDPPAGAWSYDAVKNAIVFPPGTLPDDAILVVTYDVRC